MAVPNNVDIYREHSFECACGRIHSLPIRDVDISPGAARKLADKVSELALGRHGALITDAGVHRSLGRDLLGVWQASGLNLVPLIMPGPVNPTADTVGRVLCSLPMETDFIVTLGGGSITDLGRYIASRLKLPVVAIPSAMSMDGFFTNMSVITIDDIQRTLYLEYPHIVLADTTILSTCPPHMNASGLGEAMAKVSAGLDWYLSHQIRGSYYCDTIAEIMGSCVERASDIAVAEGINRSEAAAVSALTDGLYRSAVGMSWCNASVCGSGAEHLLNHYWIRCQHLRGIRQSMHGQAVGVGAVVDLMMWEEVMNRDPSSLPNSLGPATSSNDWEVGVRTAFGEQAEEILELQRGQHIFDEQVRRAEIERIRDSATALEKKYAASPDAGYVAERLKRAGAPSTPAQLGLSREEFVTSVKYAKEMRTGRYNIIWMADTLGWLDEIAELLAGRLGY